MKSNFVIHDNIWWWGRTISIIKDDGLASVSVQFDKDYPETAFIKGLTVHPSVRQQGIGTELLKEAERVARKNNVSFMELDADIKNQWLQCWYKKNGFEIKENRENKYLLALSLK